MVMIVRYGFRRKHSDSPPIKQNLHDCMALHLKCDRISIGIGDAEKLWCQVAIDIAIGLFIDMDFAWFWARRPCLLPTTQHTQVESNWRCWLHKRRKKYRQKSLTFLSCDRLHPSRCDVASNLYELSSQLDVTQRWRQEKFLSVEHSITTHRLLVSVRQTFALRIRPRVSVRHTCKYIRHRVSVRRTVDL